MLFKRMLKTISHISFVSMNIVSRGGDNLPQGKVSPPPHLNPHVMMYAFIFM